MGHAYSSLLFFDLHALLKTPFLEFPAPTHLHFFVAVEAVVAEFGTACVFEAIDGDLELNKGYFKVGEILLVMARRDPLLNR